jgi:DNA-binding response OmpR family regulator
MRVLIIEDEIKIARNIAKVLDEEYYWAIDIATDGIEGRTMAMTNPYDLIILDLGLPKIGGLDILRELRKKGKTTPVLILTARDDTRDIIEGLQTGSDDYMVKPFDMRELMARCQALVRRSYGHVDSEIRIGDIVMEYRLLEYLAMRAGEVVSKANIEEHLYSFGPANFSNVVEVYVCSLRKKLGSESGREVIHTLRNQGYVLGELPQ